MEHFIENSDFDTQSQSPKENIEFNDQTTWTDNEDLTEPWKKVAESENFQSNMFINQWIRVAEEYLSSFNSKNNDN